MLSARRSGPLIWIPFGGAVLLVLVYLYLGRGEEGAAVTTPGPVDGWQPPEKDGSFWSKVPVHYPPPSIRPLPAGTPIRYQPVQATIFPAERDDARARRKERQQAVKQTFIKSWNAYRQYAWGSDELAPLSGGRRDHFGGWAATLVDSLDTLWIMDMKAEFDEAVATAEGINFAHTDMGVINIFETNIRFLGGFLSAFDLSGDKRLLRKAVEVGDMLYKAFDTPTRIPVARWDFHAAARGEKQVASNDTVFAELGTLSMEFTRLSMLTSDAKWFDAAQRITDLMAAQQDLSAIPGLWPVKFDGEKETFLWDSFFTLGSMADSAYEYLAKMPALTGGLLPIYRTMYEKAADAAMKYVFFRPLTPTNEDILISGYVHANDSRVELDPQGEQLVCFLGGLMALAARLFDREKDMDVAKRLVDGCLWVSKAFPHGIMPETFAMAACKPGERCEWDEKAWKREVLRRAKKDPGAADADAQADAIIEADRLPKTGFTAVPDRRYALRPEAVESAFVLYRITGREDLLETAWDMFTAINRTTSTELANSEVRDVTIAGNEEPEHRDSMESFWMAETLKYFYLIFSEPGLVSLDEFVFNTEAHPFRRLLG